MTIRMRAALAAASFIIGGALAPPAYAEEPGSYPRIVGGGESVAVEYGPVPRGNIVGGGRVHVSGWGEQSESHYLDGEVVQRAPAGAVPVPDWNGESGGTVWIPARDAAAPALGLLHARTAPHG